MLNSHCEKTFVVIFFSIASNQRNITACVAANCFKERVFSVKKSIMGPVKAMMS